MNLAEFNKQFNADIEKLPNPCKALLRNVKTLTFSATDVLYFMKEDEEITEEQYNLALQLLKLIGEVE